MVPAMAAPLGQDEWDRRAAACGYEWREPVTRARRPTLARCLTCGHEWSPRPDRAKAGHGCPRCGLARGAVLVDQSERDRQAEALGLRWLEPCGVWDEKRLVECLTCGHRWHLSPNKVQSGRGCHPCALRRQAERNRAGRIPREVRDRQAAAIGLRWLEEPTSGGAPTLAECEHGHRSRPTPWNVAQGHGCIECAVYGWRDTRPGVLYVVTNPEAGRVKIGKTNAPRSRMNDHRKDGFTDLVWMSDEAPGYEVSAAEVAALAMVGVEPVQGREYFALSRTFLVADAVSVARQAFDAATRRAKAA